MGDSCVPVVKVALFIWKTLTVYVCVYASCALACVCVHLKMLECAG